MTFLRTTHRIRHSPGFTLIELMVVCAIMVVIAGVIMSNQGKFGGQVLLQNFAYDVALSLRQAQVYGISVQRFGSGSTARFNAGYGININLSTSNKRYVLFADSAGLTPNGVYDSTAPADLAPQIMNMTRGYFISKLCVPATLTDQNDPTSCTSADRIDVLFIRPEPDALISWSDGAGMHNCFLNRSDCGPSARIVLQSPRGDTMSVVVTSNGQIAVDQTVTNN